MSFITDIFKGGTSGILDGVSKVIGNFVTDPTQKAQISEQIEEAVIGQQNLNIENAEKQFESSLNDLANARAMQIAALNQTDKFSKRFIYFLAMVVILLAVAYDVAFLYVKVPPENHDAAMIILGSLNTGGFAAVVSFFFGSSSGSKNKDETLSKIVSAQSQN